MAKDKDKVNIEDLTDDNFDNSTSGGMMKNVLLGIIKQNPKIVFILLSIIAFQFVCNLLTLILTYKVF